MRFMLNCAANSPPSVKSPCGGMYMPRDAATTERLRNLISRLISATTTGDLTWEKQVGSAHRYARLNNNLLILGPDSRITDTGLPRYLFITPFDSPACIELNSNDAELGHDVTRLAETVEAATRDKPPTDPFALTSELLGRLD